MLQGGAQPALTLYPLFVVDIISCVNSLRGPDVLKKAFSPSCRTLGDFRGSACLTAHPHTVFLTLDLVSHICVASLTKCREPKVGPCLHPAGGTVSMATAVPGRGK